MSELLVQDTSVIATADAIREKINSTEPIEWVSGKGFADVIKAIVTNSELPSGITAISTGSFVPAEGLNDDVWFRHGLGATPNFVMVFMEDQYPGVPENLAMYENYALFGILIRKKFAADDVVKTRYGFLVSFYGTDYLPGQSIRYISDDTEYVSYTLVKMKINTADFKEGVSYRWVAACIKGI